MRMDFDLEHLEGGMKVFEYFSNSTHLAERASWVAGDLQLVGENSLAKYCASICWNDQWRSLDVPSNPNSLENDDEGWLIGQFDCSLVGVAQPFLATCGILNLANPFNVLVLSISRSICSLQENPAFLISSQWGFMRYKMPFLIFQELIRHKSSRSRDSWNSLSP